MATLTETAFYTRRGLKILGFGLVIFFIVRFLFGIAAGLWLAIFPPAPAPPTLAFSKLPQIQFPQTPTGSSSASFSYSLETIAPTLSVKTQNLKVFFIPKPAPSFGAADKMRSQASRMGFTTEPIKIPSTVNQWRFSSNLNSLQRLDYDQTNGNFRLYYDFHYDLNLFSQRDFPAQADIVAQAVDFFNNLGLISPDFSTGRQVTTFFRIDVDRLVPTTSLAQADAVAVTFQRKDVSQGKTSYPVLPPDPTQGLISILFSGNSDAAKKILEAKYYFLPVDFENWATYPVISYAQAFENLKNGRAFVAQIFPNSPKQITIRKVYYAYFEPQEFQNYLQPIVVFDSGDGFLAYVPAIDPAWLGK